MENLKTAVGFLSIIAFIIYLSYFLERAFCKDRKTFSSTHYISYTAIFACMAAILMSFEIPLFFAPSFYQIDFSEVPVLICTFYLGPVAGVVSEFLKVLLKLLIKGTSSAYVGEFANFVLGCAFILPASLIYHARPGKKSSIIGMTVGTVFLTIFGSFFNAFYMIPVFAKIYGVPLEAIVGMGTAVNSSITSLSTLVFYAVAPFNLLKGILVSMITFALYKRISPILHKGDYLKTKRKKE